MNKAKNVLLLTVDGNNAPAGTGAVGSSEINTNDPMYIGGIPGLSLINAYLNPVEEFIVIYYISTELCNFKFIHWFM